MADLDEMTPGEILADSSVADFIKELGLGIAAAQTALDDNSVRQMEVFTTRRDDLGGRSLLELGMTPAFYHYQHADITCSMQIRMEIGKSDEFGFGIKAGINDESSSSGSSEDEETSTTTTEGRAQRTAELTMRADSQGALAIANGESITPTGTTPLERLVDLQTRLPATTDAIRLLFDPPDTQPEMSLESPDDNVVVDSPTVAFLRPDFNAALIRLRSNAATDFVVNGTLTVSTTAQADVDDYAAHVEQRFTAAGFGVVFGHAPGPRVEIGDAHYPNDVSVISNDDAEQLAYLAGIVKATGQAIAIEGYTDRVGATSHNRTLGQDRGEGVERFLLAQGVPRSQITLVRSRGEAEAATTDNDGQVNPAYRRTSVYATPLTEHWVIVRQGPEFDPATIAPDARGDVSGGADNAYVHLYRPEPLALSGNGVVVDGTRFAFSGTAISGGPPAGTAGAHAENLTRAINATETHRAWRQGNVVGVARSGDQFRIQLSTASSRQLSVAESSDFTISRQFERTQRSVESTNREENRTIAVGVSVDARFSRQFNMEVTGNSSISARLVSVPAPAEFLDEIQAYQNSLER